MLSSPARANKNPKQSFRRTAIAWDRVADALARKIRTPAGALARGALRLARGILAQPVWGVKGFPWAISQDLQFGVPLRIAAPRDAERSGSFLREEGDNGVEVGLGDAEQDGFVGEQLGFAIAGDE